MDTIAGLEYLGLNKIKRGWSGWVIASCPFGHLHKNNDNHPSFGMKNETDITKASYHCFSCGSKGTFKALIWHLCNGDTDRYRSMLKTFGADLFLEQIQYTYGKKQYFQVELNEIDFKVVKQKYCDIEAVPEAGEYLQKRGVNQIAVDELRLLYDTKEKRILFPIMDKKACYGLSGRSIKSREEERIYVKDYYGLDKKHFWLGEHLIDGDRPILITEGLMGLACLISNGARKLYNPVASLGAAVMEQKIPRLLKHNKSVFILFDNDNAGKTLGLQWANILCKHTPVFIFDWTKTKKEDVDFLTIDDLTLEHFKHHSIDSI